MGYRSSTVEYKEVTKASKIHVLCDTFCLYRSKREVILVGVSFSIFLGNFVVIPVAGASLPHSGKKKIRKLDVPVLVRVL